MALVFVFVGSFIFLLMPTFVGHEYKEDVFSRIQLFVRDKLNRIGKK